MTVIAHISDLHISNDAFDEEVFMKAVSEINNLQPDMIILMLHYLQFQEIMTNVT